MVVLYISLKDIKDYLYRGDEFRTDYAKLGRLRVYCSCPVMILTATVTRLLMKKIFERVDIHRSIIISLSLNRPNLFYIVRPMKLTNEV